MKTKDIKGKIKEYFLKNPTKKLRVRQIEREVKVPLPSAIRYTKELEKEGILRKEQISNITLFSANFGSNEYLLEKTAYNIKSLHTSGLIEHLIEEFGSPTIVLFGSFAKGEDTEESDIDLYIETANKDKINLDKYEKILNKEIQTFLHPSIQKVPNPHLANNILNGTKLNGFVEVFK